MPPLSAGSRGRVVMDYEDTYNVTRAVAARRPIQIDFNTSGLVATQTQNQAETITGNRAQSEPFLGNKDVRGTVVTPIDRDFLGYLLKLAIAPPSSVEDPAPGILDQVSPPVTATIATGVLTFSEAQTQVEIGDRIVIERADGSRQTMWLTGDAGLPGDTTVWDVRLENNAAGASPADTTAPATVLGAIENKIPTPASPGTVDITAGVATFSNAQANAAVGDQVLYDADNTLKRAYLSAKTSDTVWTAVDGEGFPAPDSGGALGLESVEDRTFWKHEFIQHPTNELPSATFEQRFQDVASSFLYAGCKINALQATLGGDGELLGNWEVIGAKGSVPIATPYEDDPATPAPVRPFQSRYHQFDARVFIDGVEEADTLMQIELTFGNGLDDTIFPVGAQGERTDLPEGFAAPGGTLTALFRDDTLIGKARNVQEISLRVRFEQENGDYYFEIEMPEAKMAPTNPAIDGPTAVQVQMAFQAYYTDNPFGAAIICRLRNKRESYIG